MTHADARRLALGLPTAVELPHFELTSFRVGGKIFACLTPDGTELRVFVDPDRAAALAAEHPGFARVLMWGQNVAGVAFALPDTSESIALAVLQESWKKRAPRRLHGAVEG